MIQFEDEESDMEWLRRQRQAFVPDPIEQFEAPTTLEEQPVSVWWWLFVFIPAAILAGCWAAQWFGVWKP